MTFNCKPRSNSRPTNNYDKLHENIKTDEMDSDQT